mmetsp:Transcript_14867/g.40930  ORF Transcript_14867/g.40930 Transcript_14867/m.40930 type:complete len:317 (-) Transcript_14867:201-1151(-)
MPVLASSPLRLNSLPQGQTRLSSRRVTTLYRRCLGNHRHRLLRRSLLPDLAEQAPEILHKVDKERSMGGHRIDALESNLCQQLRQRRRESGTGVKHLYDLLQTSLKMVNQVTKLVRFIVPLDSRRCSSEEFQQDHPETVHLAAFRYHTRSDVLGTGVAHSTTGLRHLVLRRRAHTSKTEIGHLSSAILVKEDVGPLDVPMEGTRTGVVQVRQTTCGIQRRTDPHVRFEEVNALPTFVQSLAHVASREVFVDETPTTCVPVSRKSHQDNQIRVTEARKNFDLLFKPSFLGHLQHLDRNLRAVSHDALVHTAECSRPE